MAVYKSLSKTEKAKPATSSSASNGIKRNKQRVLVLSSRGVTYRQRHLLDDLASMMPHSRKESKWDAKTKLHELNELAELYNCNNIVYLEARKGLDGYLFLSHPPNNCTARFHIQNMHTMDELNFTGNCLKGSRPILSFDKSFDNAPHLQLIRAMFTRVWGVPPGARKSKPFIDHVMSFSYVDGKIWSRTYQINEEEKSQTEVSKTDKDTDMSLVEIGPRFVLTPIVILEGSFGGPVIYQNKEFVSPNQVRSDLRRGVAAKHTARAEQNLKGQSRKADLGLRSNGAPKQKNELDTQMLFS